MVEILEVTKSERNTLAINLRKEYIRFAAVIFPNQTEKIEQCVFLKKNKKKSAFYQ